MVDQELITSVRQKYDALAQEAVVIASRSPSRPCSKTSKHSSNRPLAVILSRPCDGPAKVLGIWPRRLSLRAIVSAIILWLDCFWGWITVCRPIARPSRGGPIRIAMPSSSTSITCLLYTSDAADEEDSVDLGGRRIIKKKKKKKKE